MFINSYSNPIFKANLNSPRLNLCREDFYIKIKDYGNNPVWADTIIDTTNRATRMIQKNRNPEDILIQIASGVKEANQKTDDILKRLKTGVLRTMRIGWIDGNDKEVFTQYSRGKYSYYQDKLNLVRQNPLQKPAQIAMSRPNEDSDIKHGEPELINNSLDYTIKLFKNVIPRFIHGELTSKDLPLINDTVAEIRWVLAHATPWLRGSDTISNVLMRAIYKAVGVKTYPPAKGVSFDMEAFCTNLEDYKKKFPTYFEKAPEVIE